MQVSLHSIMTSADDLDVIRRVSMGLTVWRKKGQKIYLLDVKIDKF